MGFQLTFLETLAARYPSVMPRKKI